MQVYDCSAIGPSVAIRLGLSVLSSFVLDIVQESVTGWHTSTENASSSPHSAHLDKVAVDPYSCVRVDGSDRPCLFDHQSTRVHRILIRPHLVPAPCIETSRVEMSACVEPTIASVSHSHNESDSNLRVPLRIIDVIEIATGSITLAYTK